MVAEPVSRGKASTIRHTGAIRSALWAPTAGNEKTVTEINLPPPEEIPVSTLPSSVLQIATEPGQPGFEGVDIGERRNCAADASVQIGMRTPPVSPEEALHAIVGNREGVDIDATQRAAELLDGREDRAIDLHDLGEVVVDQPEARGRRRSEER